MLDELSEYFLRQLVDLGGYCTALQAEALGIAETAKRIRGRLRMLERLGFLRRVTKYPVVYQVTKSATRLHGPDSSTRRRHMPPTVQARLLGVHFYLEALTWPATFFFDHEEKIMTLQSAQCPLNLLPQRNGKPYLREHLVFLLPDKRLGVAMIDLLQPGMMSRLRAFLRQYLPLLRHLRDEMDLLIVTADKRRAFTYQRLLRTNRTVLKLGLGALTTRVKLYSVKPPVPTIDEVIWPKADPDDMSLEIDEHGSDFGDTRRKYDSQLIGE
ncbi:MAG: hypothetical protein ACE14M_13330 [Terriglobales bacterium]